MATKEHYPILDLPLQAGETPGEYMNRYLLALSVDQGFRVSWSDVARHLNKPIQTVLAHKDGRPPQDFATIYAYSTFFGPNILRAFGVSLAQLAYILSKSDDPDVQNVLAEMHLEARARRSGEPAQPDNLARQTASG